MQTRKETYFVFLETIRQVQVLPLTI